MTYEDSGFDQFFQRTIDKKDATGLALLSGYNFDSYISDFMADKIQGGTIKSRGGEIELNLDEGYIRTNDDFVEDRVRIGRLDNEGNIGIRIKNSKGETLLQSTQNSDTVTLPNSAVMSFGTVSSDQPRVLATTDLAYTNIAYTKTSFKLDRHSVVIFFVTYTIMRDDWGSGSTYNTSLDLALMIDGKINIFSKDNSYQGPNLNWYGESNQEATEIANFGFTQSESYVQELEAGNHIAQLVWKMLGSGLASQTLLYSSISYIVL